MEINRAEKIVQDIGKFSEVISGKLSMLFFGNSIPESLLPYPKNEIYEAMDIMIQLNKDNENYVKAVEAIRTNITFSFKGDKESLQSFIEKVHGNEELIDVVCNGLKKIQESYSKNTN